MHRSDCAASPSWRSLMMCAPLGGRLELDRDPVEWMDDALAEHKIELLPLTPAIGALSVAYGAAPVWSTANAKHGQKMSDDEVLGYGKGGV